MNGVLQKLSGVNSGTMPSIISGPTGQSKTTSILQLLKDRVLANILENNYKQTQSSLIVDSDLLFWRQTYYVFLNNDQNQEEIDIMKEWLKKNGFDEDFSKWADKDKMLFKLRWC